MVDVRCQEKDDFLNEYFGEENYSFVTKFIEENELELSRHFFEIMHKIRYVELDSLSKNVIIQSVLTAFVVKNLLLLMSCMPNEGEFLEFFIKNVKEQVLQFNKKIEK
jgi:hypothetical protein